MKRFEAHILVVDDDDGIRDLVKQYLNENNYLPSCRNDQQLKKNPSDFSLLVVLNCAAFSVFRACYYAVFSDSLPS